MRYPRSPKRHKDAYILATRPCPMCLFRKANYIRSIDYILVKPTLIKTWAPLGPVHITPQRSSLSLQEHP